MHNCVPNKLNNDSWPLAARVLLLRKSMKCPKSVLNALMKDATKNLVKVGI